MLVTRQKSPRVVFCSQRPSPRAGSGPESIFLSRDDEKICSQRRLFQDCLAGPMLVPCHASESEVYAEGLEINIKS